MKILFFIHTEWAFGRIHKDLVRELARYDVLADLLDWTRPYPIHVMRELAEDYDLVVTVPNEARVLTKDYGLDPRRIAVVAHGESDLRETPLESWPFFAGFAVVSEGLRDLASSLSIPRAPDMLRVGVDLARFSSEPVRSLSSLGYAGVTKRIEGGRDIKRGDLGELIAREAGLLWAPVHAGAHLLSMPGYYRSIDAIVVTSLVETVSLPALEAAASGRVVLGTPVGVLPELAEKGGAILLPFEEVELVRAGGAALRALRSDPAKLQRQITSGLEASARRSWRSCIADWLSFFEEASRRARKT